MIITGFTKISNMTTLIPPSTSLLIQRIKHRNRIHFCSDGDVFAKRRCVLLQGALKGELQEALQKTTRSLRPDLSVSFSEQVKKAAHCASKTLKQTILPSSLQ